MVITKVRFELESLVPLKMDRFHGLSDPKTPEGYQKQADAYKEGMVDRDNVISVQLLELPENIRVQALRIQLLAEDIEKLRLSIENGKNQALELVLSATEEGKPKYTNDKARNLAVQQLLRDDELYLSSIDELSRKESELRREQIQLDYLENMFYAYRAVAGMRGVK